MAPMLSMFNAAVAMLKLVTVMSFPSTISLRSAGLEVPKTVALLEALRQGGWGVRTDQTLLEEAIAEIAQARERLEVSL